MTNQFDSAIERWDAEDALRQQAAIAITRARALEVAEDPDELEAIADGDLIVARRALAREEPTAEPPVIVLAQQPDQIISPPTEPMAVARELVAARFTDPVTESPVLRHWRGGWWSWQGSHWVEREDRSVRRDAYDFTETAIFPAGDGYGSWSPTRHKIANLLEALQAVTYLEATVDQPSWIEEVDSDDLIVACANGLLELRSRRLLAHDPRFFNQTAVPFDYQPEGIAPDRWVSFLDQLWPGDPASVAALGEWFGYVVSGRLDLHKILLIVGPTRGGKGTIARILGKMIGPRNVAGPTLSSLSYDFGLAPLLGKGLAVISDARLDSKRDTSVVVERLLAISGEDTVTVNRKYRDQWTGKLPTRFLVISNELPRLGDASATIANRFVVLLLTRSWLGQEDLALEPALTEELSGILNWSLEGLDRLTSQGRFTRPDSTDDAILALQDLASPVAAFVRDRCERGAMFEVSIDTIYRAWVGWADDNGQRRTSAQTFGRDLRAVVPGLGVIRPRHDGDRERRYRGIRLREFDPQSPIFAAQRGPMRPSTWKPGPGPHWAAGQPNVDSPTSLSPAQELP